MGRRAMDAGVQATSIAGEDLLADVTEYPDLGFLPQHLKNQCRSLIESYHGLNGYGCLPDILWRARLGPLIEAHLELRQILRKASTTRSAKKSNDGFAQIATTLLALEILSSNFAGWSSIYPQAASSARTILRRPARGSHTPLIDSYLYPPRHMSTTAIATLAPPIRPERSELQSESVGMSA